METIFLNETSVPLRSIPLWIFSTAGSPTPGLSFAAGEILISKGSGGSEINAQGSMTDSGGGLYFYQTHASEVDSLGDLSIRLNKSGCKATINVVSVVPNVADVILKRDFSDVTGEAERSLLNAARKSMNKLSLVGNTLTIYKENDSTVAFSQQAVVNPLGAPLSELDTN